MIPTTYDLRVTVLARSDERLDLVGLGARLAGAPEPIPSYAGPFRNTVAGESRQNTSAIPLTLCPLAALMRSA